MSSPIQPALTPDEWARLRTAPPFVVPNGHVLTEAEISELTAESSRSSHFMCAAGNAGLPDGDSRKITRADVDAAACSSLLAFMGQLDLVAPQLRLLATKLAALLPPDA